MNQAPKKNISKYLADIRTSIKPRTPANTLYAYKPKTKNHLRDFLNAKKRFLRPIGIAGAAILAIYALSLANAKIVITRNVDKILEQAATLKYAIPEFRTETIAQSLETTNQAIQTIHSQTKTSGLLLAISALSRFFPPLTYVPDSLNSVALLSEDILQMGKDVDYLKKNGVQFMTQQKGGELIATLERLEKNIGDISRLNAEIKNTSFHLKTISSELAAISGIIEKNYIPVSLQLYRAQSFLQAFLNILKQPGDQHLLLLFQNPSEMRPAGGFIGSFGDITINQGNVTNIAVDDIYNADRQLKALIVPPKELQSITKKWGARDANWFFNFPTSAQKVIGLLEQSDLYFKPLVQFHGAVAVNTNILETLLKITGPIALPEYGRTVDSSNFLKEIQYEVEAGRDKKPGQNPKRILSALMPRLIEKLHALTDEQKNQLIAGFKNHFEKKDILIYFKDWKLQNFVESIGVAGEVVPLPKNFTGDYLAITNTNVGGGKTDAVITQTSSLQSEITAGGDVVNTLTITRTHNGLKEKDWWYRSANKNYLKILVPENAKLLSVQGNDPAPASAAYDYAKEKYGHDSDIQEMEKSLKPVANLKAWSGKESGKTSFGTWTSVKAGAEKTTKIVYKNERAVEVADGTAYEFFFEKQSGNTSSFSYSVTAPPGYRWKESQSETFTYETPEPNGREHLKITLTKI